MASVFSKIIDGELPGRFVWSDETCVAFLTIAPVAPGHTLVVPRAEVDKWTDLPAEEFAHLMSVAQIIGRAVVAAFDAPRAGELIAGFEVPHTHVHVFPAWDMGGFDLSRANSDVADAEMDSAAAAIRAALREAGNGEHVAE
ncbi:HIT family protein [Dietzia sp.]|uniref:HIT family protein n=1 Tax=Dietzia sp. TaxID=1871616 RepID=UPI002FD91C4E